MRGLCSTGTIRTILVTLHNTFSPKDIKLMEGFFDTEYFIEDYVNRKPHWRGLGKSHIYFMPKTKVWRLESFYATEKYADLPADDTDPYAFFPLGRLKWRIFDGICQMSEG